MGSNSSQSGAAMMETDAREQLAALREEHGDAYFDLIWQMRYPEPSPKASDGWPFRPSTGVVEPERIRAVKK